MALTPEKVQIVNHIIDSFIKEEVDRILSYDSPNPVCFIQLEAYIDKLSEIQCNVLFNPEPWEYNSKISSKKLTEGQAAMVSSCMSPNIADLYTALRNNNIVESVVVVKSRIDDTVVLGRGKRLSDIPLDIADINGEIFRVIPSDIKIFFKVI